jgi:photosynthetic reaction center H subunit
MNDAIDRVVPLDQLSDYRVAEGNPDVRGWEVLDANGRRIGEVDNLLIDTAAMKVRYLDVDLAEDVAGEDRDRHILVPIGYARLDEAEDHVFVDSLDREQLRAMPVYDHTPLTRDYETSVRRRFDQTYTGTSPERDFYASDLYDADRFYGSRRTTGENPLA